MAMTATTLHTADQTLGQQQLDDARALWSWLVGACIGAELTRRCQRNATEVPRLRTAVAASLR